MSKLAIWIFAALVVGLAAGTFWLGGGLGARAGEVVPDDEAATLRGGSDACNKQSQTTCLGGKNPDQDGHDCRAKPVWDLDVKNGTRNPYNLNDPPKYCGGTLLQCNFYYDVYPDRNCSASGTATP